MTKREDNRHFIYLEAKIVTSPEEYKYSSARFYVHGQSDGITTEDPTFETFGKDIDERRKKYAEFLKIPDEKTEELFREKETPLGNAEFNAKLLYIKGRYLPRRKGKTRTYTTLSV